MMQWCIVMKKLVLRHIATVTVSFSGLILIASYNHLQQFADVLQVSLTYAFQAQNAFSIYGSRWIQPSNDQMIFRL